jgi:hypothetical protein
MMFKKKMTLNNKAKMRKEVEAAGSISISGRPIKIQSSLHPNLRKQSSQASFR